MTEALENRLIDLRERVDDLLAKQKAYRRKHLKTKQLKQQSKTNTLQNPEPLNLQRYQIKDREQKLTKQRRLGMKYLGIAVIIGIVFGAFVMGGGGDKAVDLLSLIFVLGVAAGHALGVKDGESAIIRFGRRL